MRKAVLAIMSLSLLIAPLSTTFAKGGRGGGWGGGRSWSSGWSKSSSWSSGSKSSSWSGKSSPVKSSTIKSSSTPKVIQPKPPKVMVKPLKVQSPNQKTEPKQIKEITKEVKRKEPKEKESGFWTFIKYYILYKLFFGGNSGRAQETGGSSGHIYHGGNSTNGTIKAKEIKTEKK